MLFFLPSKQEGKEKLRAATQGLARPSDTRACLARPAGPGPGSEPAQARGREGGWQEPWAARPGPALLCAHSSHLLCQPASQLPRPAASGPATRRRPPGTHPGPTRGCPHLMGLQVLLVPGAPGPSSAPPSSPHPTARALQQAWHHAKQPGRPGRELAGEGLCGEGCGLQTVPGDREAQMPGGHPSPPASPSPEPHKGSDNRGGSVQTACAQPTNKQSHYLFI